MRQTETWSNFRMNKAISVRTIWNRSGTPCSLLFSMGDGCGFADLAEFATDAIDSWLPSLRTDVMVRLSSEAWNQLAVGCSEGTIRRDDAGIFSKFLLLSPEDAWRSSDAAAAFDVLRNSGFRIFLGNMALDRNSTAMAGKCEGAELSAAVIPKEFILSLAARLAAAKKTVLASSISETHFAKQILGTTKAVVAGSSLEKREGMVPPPTLLPDAVDAFELAEGAFAGREASWFGEELVSKPACSHRLVSMVNAAGIKSQKAVSTARGAVDLLGPRKIRTWMTLLLLSSPTRHPWAQVIRFNVLLRAKLAETFCARELGAARSEDLFPLFLLAGAEILFDRSKSDIAKAAGLTGGDLTDFTGSSDYQLGLQIADDLMASPERALQWTTRFDTGRRDVQKIIHASIFWCLSFQSFATFASR